MKIAVYPGTFDPVTNGHVALIKRAGVLFDRVIVAVAHNQRKMPCFSLEERLTLVRQVFEGATNIRTEAMHGLLVDFAAQHQASCIVRGLRTATDFDHESQQAGVNYQLAPAIETVFLPAVDKTALISSTLVREIIDVGGDVSDFVPTPVALYLQSRR